MRKSKRVVKADPVVDDEENEDVQEEEAPPSKKVCWSLKSCLLKKFFLPVV